MAYNQKVDIEPENLRELAENLSNTFSENYRQNKSNSSLNPSRYLSRTCFDSSDTFRDKLGNFDPTKLTFSAFGDELISENDDNNSNNAGIKRIGTDLDGPINKKMKLNNEPMATDNENNDNQIENEEDEDEDSDIKMSDDDENTNKKKQKRKKIKLPEKFKDDEDFRALEAPPITPSKANEFFDPVNHCKINLDVESKINIKTKRYLNTFELFNNNDVEINENEIKYIKHNELNKYLISTANKNGYTLQKEISVLLCLGLKDHLKNMFDGMDKWRKLRNDQQKNINYKIKYDAMDKQERIDSINEKYCVKQKMTEVKDEIEALETEKTDLDFKKMTGILTDEETKRRQKLDDLIRKAKQNQKRNDELRANTFSLAALGGAFSFNFNPNRNDNKNINKKTTKSKGRKLQSDKFYVIDVINMIENHQKYNQQHLKQLSKLYLKHI